MIDEETCARIEREWRAEEVDEVGKAQVLDLVAEVRRLRSWLEAMAPVSKMAREALAGAPTDDQIVEGLIARQPARATTTIRDAIRAAVLAEREACARLLEKREIGVAITGSVGERGMVWRALDAAADAIRAKAP